MHWKPSLPDLFLAIYLTAIGLEAALGRFGLVTSHYRAKDTIANLGMTVGNIAMNLLMAGTVFAGLSWAFKAHLLDISPTSLAAWVVLFFLDDLTYYCFHRISHECRFWWAAHVNHHSSRQYNLSTAIRQSWSSVIVGTWIPWIPLAFVGFPPAMILSAQGFNLFYQFWIHTEMVDRMPRWFEYILNTPSHHRVHHASNPRYLDRNYGGVLIIWDRLFGTFVEESRDEKPQYGIVHDIDTFNPIRIAFHEWLAMLRDILTARTVAQALGFVFGPPGWRADGTGHTSASIRAKWASSQSQP
jgi:sterol desaturase/sphingolipid hydroxylase (fatty acid hydroxylase superfamily)